MELRGKRALVTGATGFIGGHLADRLLREGVHVRAFVRDPAKASQLAAQGAEIFVGDITRPATLPPALQGCQILFHAAAYVGESGDREAVWAVNVDGTRNVVQAAVDTGLERFVHVSSCAVYGSPQRFDIDESTPTRLKGEVYHDSKLAAEQIVFQAYREQDLPVVVARPSQVYGPGSRQFTIRPVELIKAGRMILIDGGRHLCKPVYIDSVVEGLLRCAQVDEAVGQAINLTDGIGVPWRDFFGYYGKMLGVERFPSLPYPVAWVLALTFELRAAMKGKRASLNRRAIHSLRSSNSFSNLKARQLLGWEPVVSLDEGMRRTAAWLKENGYLD